MSGLSKRACRLIGLSIGGEPFGVIDGATSFETLAKYKSGSLEHRDMMVEIHHLDCMLDVLFQAGILVYAEDASQGILLNDLWDTLLGSFDTFRVRWQNDSVAANGAPREDGFVPRFFRIMVQETFHLQHWKWSLIEVSKDRTSNYVLPHIRFGADAHALRKRALHAVPQAIQDRFESCKKWCITARLNSIISAAFEFSFGKTTRITELRGLLARKDPGVGAALIDTTTLIDHLEVLGFEVFSSGGSHGVLCVSGITMREGKDANLGEKAIVATLGRMPPLPPELARVSFQRLTRRAFGMTFERALGNSAQVQSERWLSLLGRPEGDSTWLQKQVMESKRLATEVVGTTPPKTRVEPSELKPTSKGVAERKEEKKWRGSTVQASNFVEALNAVEIQATKTSAKDLSSKEGGNGDNPDLFSISGHKDNDNRETVTGLADWGTALPAFGTEVPEDILELVRTKFYSGDYGGNFWAGSDDGSKVYADKPPGDVGAVTAHFVQHGVWKLGEKAPTVPRVEAGDSVVFPDPIATNDSDRSEARIFRNMGPLRVERATLDMLAKEGMDTVLPEMGVTPLIGSRASQLVTYQAIGFNNATTESGPHVDLWLFARKMDKESRKTITVDGVPMRGMELQEIARMTPEALTKLKDEGKIIQFGQNATKMTPAFVGDERVAPEFTNGLQKVTHEIHAQLVAAAKIDPKIKKCMESGNAQMLQPITRNYTGKKASYLEIFAKRYKYDRPETIEYKLAKNHTPVGNAITKEAFTKLDMDAEVSVTYINTCNNIRACGQDLAATKFAFNVAECEINIQGYRVRLIRSSVIVFSGRKTSQADMIVRANPNTAHVDWMFRSNLRNTNKLQPSSAHLDYAKHIVKLGLRTQKKHGIPVLMRPRLKQSSLGRQAAKDASFSIENTLADIPQERIEAYSTDIAKRWLQSKMHIPESLWTEETSNEHIALAMRRLEGESIHATYFTVRKALDAWANQGTRTAFFKTILDKDAAVKQRNLALSVDMIVMSNTRLDEDRNVELITHPDVEATLHSRINAEHLLKKRFRKVRDRKQAEHEAKKLSAEAKPVDGKKSKDFSPWTADELAQHLAGPWSDIVLFELLMVSLRVENIKGRRPTIGAVGDGRVPMDKYDFPTAITQLDPIAYSFVPKIKTRSGWEWTEEATKNWLAVMLVITNIEESQTRDHIISCDAIMSIPDKGLAPFINHVKSLQAHGDIDFRFSRMTCTAHGEIEGNRSSGWPWFFHCWEESIAKSDITALHEATTLKAMVDAIHGMPFRFKWLVARELRKVSTNIERDGEVDITINPGGKKFFPNLGIHAKQREPFSDALAKETLKRSASKLKKLDLPQAEKHTMTECLESLSKGDHEGLVCDEAKVARWMTEMYECMTANRQLAFMETSANFHRDWTGTFELQKLDDDGIYVSKSLTLVAAEPSKTVEAAHSCAERALSSLHALPKPIYFALRRARKLDPPRPTPKMVVAQTPSRKRNTAGAAQDDRSVKKARVTKQLNLNKRKEMGGSPATGKRAKR